MLYHIVPEVEFRAQIEGAAYRPGSAEYIEAPPAAGNQGQRAGDHAG